MRVRMVEVGGDRLHHLQGTGNAGIWGILLVSGKSEEPFCNCSLSIRAGAPGRAGRLLPRLLAVAPLGVKSQMDSILPLRFICS